MTILNDKSRLHFQPLLFDSFKYKSPHSTYQDHYKSLRKKQNSALNKQYDSCSQKAKSTALHRGKKPVNFVHNNINIYKKNYEIPVFNDDEIYNEYLCSKNTIYTSPKPNAQHIYVVNDDNNYARKYQHVNFHPQVTVNEISGASQASMRPQSNTNIAYNIQLNVDENIQSMKLQSPPPTITHTLSVSNTNDDENLAHLVEDNLHLENQVLTNQINDYKPPTETSKVTSKSNLHWSIYPQEAMPDYIAEAKKRLGQMKNPNDIPNYYNKTSTVSPKTPEPKGVTITKHWSQVDNPSTPDYIKQIRKRLGDDRYRKTDICKSKSFSNLKSCETPTVITSPKPATPLNEPYKIPTYLHINNNVHISTNRADSVQLTTENPNLNNILPVPNEVNDEANKEIEHAIELTKNYEETQPSYTENYYKNERVVNSRTSNESKMSQNSKIYDPLLPPSTTNIIPFDTWVKNHATEKEKDSVLRALNVSHASPDRPSPSPCPGTPQHLKQPVYLYNGPQHEFMNRNQNQQGYNDFVRATVKTNPSPMGSYRKGTPTIRKLGQTRGQNLMTNFSMEEEKNFIRDYLWNTKSHAIIRTGFGVK